MVNLKDILSIKYKIGTIEKIELIKRDKVHIYRIYTNRNNFYFRAHPNEDKRVDIQVEIEYLDFLNAEGLNVEKVVPTIDGLKIIEYESSRYGVLYTEVHGQIDLNPSYERLRSTIKAIKLLHEKSWTFNKFPKVKSIALENGLEKFFNNEIDLPAEVTCLYLSIIKYYSSKRLCYQKHFNYSVCHGDFHLENILYDQDKVGIIDFDYLHKAYQVYDIATLIWTIMPRNETESKNLKKQKVEYILSTYFGDGEYLSEKRQLTLLMVLMRHIWRQYIRVKYDEFESYDEMRELFSYQSNILNNWIDYFEIKFDNT